MAGRNHCQIRLFVAQSRLSPDPTIHKPVRAPCVKVKKVFYELVSEKNSKTAASDLAILD